MEVPSVYSESHSYSYFSDDESVTLSKLSSVNSSDAGQNTRDTSNQTNVFDLRGQLLWSRIESRTLFLPREEPVPPNSNHYRIDLNQSSHQVCEMERVESFLAKQEDVTVFGGFLQHYRSRG